MNEFRVIEYRCAVTGSSFCVQFGRKRVTDKYRGVTVQRASWPKSVAQMVANRLYTWLPRWLLPIFGRFFRLANLLSRSTACSFVADEFDFTGWHCPCCGYMQGENHLFAFVHCPQCNGLVCGGRLDGSQFRCHDGCGHTETCTETMERIDGSISNRDPRLLGSPPAATAALQIGIASNRGSTNG